MSEAKNAWTREYRAKTGNASTKKYERSPKGKLMRSYRNMQSRIGGSQKAKYHLYAGKDLMPREEFYEWSLNDPDFWRLYVRWEESGFSPGLSPSVDRIDPSKGYILGNVRWLSHSENSKLGAINRNALHGLPCRRGTT